MFRDIDEKAVNVILIVRWWNTSIRLDRSINRISAVSDLLLRFYEGTLCIKFIVFCEATFVPVSVDNINLIVPIRTIIFW